MLQAKAETIQNVLRKVLHGPNKVSKELAVERAKANVEQLRGAHTNGLTEEVSKIHVLAASGGGNLPEEVFRETLFRAGVSYNLAGALGHTNLQIVCASLLDLLNTMSERNVHCADPVLVHARAALLFLPGMPALPEDDAKKLLANLKGVVAFFEASGKPCDEAGCEKSPRNMSQHPEP